jgi:hypothetical protein
VGLGDDGVVVVLAGGVFRHHGSDLREAIAAALPGYDVASTAMEPAYGAVLMAADGLSLRPDVDRLVASGPGPELFDTGSG